ncbi:MAG TPA: cytidylate kinase family protein [Candidatus Nanoarchaeia archaeon]|nr:cytidylate kinase family protein [Candidatus Nanoarchaeia archaeon]
MKITISGRAGSGKSTVAKIVAKKLKLRHYSMGDMQRQIAGEKGISMLELGKIEEKNPEFDEYIDDFQRNLGREDNFIVDSRLGFHFIPSSIKIFLDVSLKEGAHRIFNQLREYEKYNTSLENTEKKIVEREKSEIQRYKKYYGIKHFDKKNYDFVIDTTYLSPEEIVEKIIKFCMEKKRKL